MTLGNWTELPDRGVVEVGGPDARHFLHNLVTSDLERVAHGRAGYGALLTPQGKILFDFIMLADGDRFLLDTPRDKAAELAKRLGFYKLRAAVEIADRSAERTVIAAWDSASPPPLGAIVAPDPRLPALGFRAVVTASTEPPGWHHATPADYAAHRIALAVPEGGKDFAFGDAFPHDADMDQLGGVDFVKGCYTGQEVVSRMEHRGTARRRIIRIRSKGGPLPTAGTAIIAGGQELGTIGSVSGEEGLASIRLDRAAEAILAGTPISAGGIAVELALPQWAKFVWPDIGASQAS